MEMRQPGRKEEKRYRLPGKNDPGRRTSRSGGHGSQRCLVEERQRPPHP